jgi:hypothetical protein
LEIIMSGNRKKGWRVKWGAVGAVAGIAGALFAYLGLKNGAPNVAGDHIEVATRETAPRPGPQTVPPPSAQNGPAARPGNSARSGDQTSVRPEPASGQGSTAAQTPAADASAPPPRSEPQRVINIGPVSTNNQQNGINAGYIENNNPGPRQ